MTYFHKTTNRALQIARPPDSSPQQMLEITIKYSDDSADRHVKQESFGELYQDLRMLGSSQSENIV